jgi:hypothetical protein
VFGIKMETWNVTGFKGKADEVKLYSLDYLGITETKRKGRGLTQDLVEI